MGIHFRTGAKALRMLTTSAVLLVAIAFGCREILDPPDTRNTSVLQPAMTQVAVGISPDGDTYVSRTESQANFGTDTILRLDGNRRALLRWDSLALAEAVGSDSLVAAHLELTIVSNSGSWGSGGGVVTLHPMSTPWSETQAVWTGPEPCPSGHICTGNWMDLPLALEVFENGQFITYYYPYRVEPAADSATLNNSSSGVVSFDVTAEVAQVLAGGYLYRHGWLVRKVNEGAGGAVGLGSRESANPPRLVLTVLQQTPQVPAVAPDTLPADLYDPTNIRDGSVCMSGPQLKDIVVVRFKVGTPQTDRQAALDLVDGVVVGGRPPILNEGFYYIRVEHDATGQALCDARAALRELPYVDAAHLEQFAVVSHLQPDDSTEGWRKGQWQLSPLFASGDNWGLESIEAPLAWGCSVGDAQTAIAVLDNGFRGIDDLTENIGPWDSHLDQYPETNHGTRVTSILAAAGNNGRGMTGVMWKASIRPYDVRTFTDADTVPPTALASALEQAIADGARIVNASWGLDWPSPPDTLSLQDAARVTDYIAPIASALRNTNALQRPLLVVAAGNDGINAYWNALPALLDEFPSHILTVAAYTINGSLASISNRGPYVEIAAPGDGVGALNGDGTITAVQPATSYATPFVTGVAGLIASFDPRLAVSDIKSLLLEGAVTTPGSIPRLNAYKALKAAAARPGAPLCGSLVWASAGGTLERRREGTTFETLFQVGSPIGHLEVLHGGKFIRYITEEEDQTVAKLVKWHDTQPHWRSEELGLNPPAPRGGTYRSAVFATSHDGDSLVFVNDTIVNNRTNLDPGQRWYDTGTTAAALVITGKIGYTLDVAGTITIDDLPEPVEIRCMERLASNPDFCTFYLYETRVWRFRLGYPQFPQFSGGKTAYIAVSPHRVIPIGEGTWHTCSYDAAFQCREIQSREVQIGATIYRMNIASTNAPAVPVETFAGQTVFWTGQGESGAEVVFSRGSWDLTHRVSTEVWDSTGSPYFDFVSSVEECRIEYRENASFGTAIVSPIANDDACPLGTLSTIGAPATFVGGGTIAPRYPSRAREVLQSPHRSNVKRIASPTLLGW